MLTPGDLVPWFEGRSSFRPALNIETLAGRYIVLSFLGSSTHPASRQLIDDVEREQAQFDVRNAMFCGVVVDPEDERRLRQKFPGVIYFWDGGAAVSRLYGAVGQNNSYTLHTLVLDPGLRVIALIPFQQDNSQHLRQVLDILKKLPPTIEMDLAAPVLILPNVLEPQLCRAMIDLYETHGGKDLGRMADVGGQTVRVFDDTQKKRLDYTIVEREMLLALEDRLRRRVFPQIKKAFQFNATQVERYIISCYDAQTGGYFRAHRDDQTRGTAHRRFAISMGLDASAYEGGDLRFPEYGYRTYRAPTGGAVVFSCTLMHEVRPVTRGKRYAFLPFVYDEDAARVRAVNAQALAAEAK